MKSIGVLLVVIAFQTPPALGYTRAAIDSSKSHSHASENNRKRLEQDAKSISTELEKIAIDFDDLFEDLWLKYAASTFGQAQLATRSLIHDGEVDLAKVAELHNELDEFIRALKSMPSWQSGTTGQNAELKGRPKPKGSQVKKLLAAAEKVKKKANKSPGFEELSRIRIDKNTTPARAVQFGTLTLDRVWGVIMRRGLGPITGGGRNRTQEVMAPSLDGLREALEALVDEHGDRVLQVDEYGKPLKDQLARVKLLLKEVNSAARLLKKRLRWVNNKYGGPSRLDVALEDLARLKKVIVKPNALTALPSSE